MSIALFDVQAGFGGPKYGETEVVTAGDWAREMRRLDIEGALVRIMPDGLVRDPPDANEDLFAACEEHPAMVPCPILIPAGAHDVPSEAEQVATAVARGAGAAFLRPEMDLWDLDEWCSGRLFAALEARRLPAFCSAGKFTFSQVADVARRYPALPLILAEVHYLNQRRIVPLLAAFANVFLSMGSNYVVFQGLELIVGELGPERVLFGTGFPQAEPMGAIMQLAYAGIPDDAKRLIGRGNAARLMEGIQR
ncbi:MAG: amidohydrolase family protein [Candidatus Hydrogenedentes bacterium]|nr:amidohydrolase family protein [Candidatus Hydrogenedentota bacterium]